MKPCQLVTKKGLATEASFIMVGIAQAEMKRAMLNPSICPAFAEVNEARIHCRREEVAEVFETPLLDLVYSAARVHRLHNDPQMVSSRSRYQIHPQRSFGTCKFPEWILNMQVQRCTLLSIKTGGCPENCNYCAQSSSWSKDTGLKAEKLMGLEEVYEVGFKLNFGSGVMVSLLHGTDSGCSVQVRQSLWCRLL